VNAFYDLQVPLYRKQEAGGMIDEGNRDDFSGAGFDFLAGPIYAVYRGDKLKVPLTLGYHYNLLLLQYSQTNWSSSINTQHQGIGLAAGAEFYPAKYFYLFVPGETVI
jgi:hypothetical protein